MPLPDQMGISPVKAKKIKLAAGCRCECCQDYYPLSILEIHYIPQNKTPSGSLKEDLQRCILVLCPVCHREIHQFAHMTARQNDLVKRRPLHIKQDMRDILEYTPKNYSPPDDIDLVELYADSFISGAPDIFLNGA